MTVRLGRCSRALAETLGAAYLADDTCSVLDNCCEVVPSRDHPLSSLERSPQGRGEFRPSGGSEWKFWRSRPGVRDSMSSERDKLIGGFARRLAGK